MNTERIKFIFSSQNWIRRSSSYKRCMN